MMISVLNVGSFYLPITLRRHQSCTIPDTIMPGETSLNKLLCSLKVTLQPNVYVFISLPPEKAAYPFPVPFTDIRVSFWEAEGVTLVMPLELAEKYEFDFSYKCRMVTLDVHSSLE